MTEVFCRGDISLGSACLECGRCAVNLADHYKRAVATLQRLGYTDCGGELWKPPLGLLHKPRREIFDGSRKVRDESGVVHMRPSADLPEPAWRAATIRTTEDAYSAEQMRQQFDAGRTFQAGRSAAVPESHTQALKAIAEWPVTDMLLNMDASNMRGIAQHALAAPAQGKVSPEHFDPPARATVTVRETEALVEQLVRMECNKTRVHQEYMGKAMPDDVYERFQRMRDESIPELRAQVRAALAAAPAQEDGARYRILRDNPRIAHRFAGLHAWQRDQYVDAVRAAAKKGGAA